MELLLWLLGLWFAPVCTLTLWLFLTLYHIAKATITEFLKLLIWLAKELYRELKED